MRIKAPEKNLQGKEWFINFVSKFIFGYTAGPLLASIYRRDFFGTAFANLSQSSLKETTYWESGEAEMFGAFVSKLNACAY